MTDKKEFLILDCDCDRVATRIESKAEAIEIARQKMADNGTYAPYTIYEAVAIVKRASPPATVIDL